VRRPRTFAGFVGFFLVLSMRAHAAEKLTWTPIADAILRIDDRAPKQWELYSAGKKFDPLLLRLGSRALVIYVRDQVIYEILPTQLEHKGKELLWRETDRPEKPLATSEWSTHDVGSAWRIRLKLASEGRVVDIQIPQTPDFRHGIY
jgi:hypothetical protein